MPRRSRAIGGVCTSSHQWLPRLCTLRRNGFEDSRLKLPCCHETLQNTYRGTTPSRTRRHEHDGDSRTGGRRIGVAADWSRRIRRAAAERRSDRAQRRLRTQRGTKWQAGKRHTQRRGRRRRDRGHDGTGVRRRMPEQPEHDGRRAWTCRPVDRRLDHRTRCASALRHRLSTRAVVDAEPEPPRMTQPRVAANLRAESCVPSRRLAIDAKHRPIVAHRIPCAATEYNLKR